MAPPDPGPSEFSPVGSLGTARSAGVDDRGGIRVPGKEVRIEWWVGAEDRWHVAADEPAVRQRRLGAAPAYETAMRVPGGDVVHRVHAIGGAGDVVVVEVENETSAAVALALVVHGLPAGARLGGARIDLDHDLALDATKPAARAVVAADPIALVAALERGDHAGSVPTAVPGEGLEVALLHPLAHRTRARFGLVLDPNAGAATDLVAAPGAADAARGWDVMLRRGMQVVFADPVRQTETDRARTDVLLAAGLPSAGPELFTVLEDWGLDVEAVEVWHRMGWRDRRRAARRRFQRGPSRVIGIGGDAAARLRATRDAVLAERADGAIVLAPEPPGPGEPLEVHDAPTRSGSVSYAVRWHGARPAILWDVQAPARSLRVVAPALGGDWTTAEPSGEVLLDPGPVTAGGA